MTELLTAAQMKAIEAAAIASGQVTGLELMERAGRGVVDAVFAEWPELQAGTFRAVVLCGPGGNGGDGFVVARLLKEWGWQVEVFLYGTPEGMPPDARVNYERWLAMGEVGALVAADLLNGAAEEMVEGWENRNRCVIIDALFGTGMVRQIDIGLNSLFQWIDMSLYSSYRQRYCLVSVDIPSGLSADSGKCLDQTLDQSLDYNAFRAHLTVTFHRAKFGHVLADGPEQCGKLVVADIGLRGDGGVSNISAPDYRIKKYQSFNKFDHGHALILSGPPGHGGAARLSARGALRIGAGLVTVACPQGALAENAARLDAVMLRVVEDGAGLATVLQDTRINALCIGPGLGLDARAVRLVATVLEVSRSRIKSRTAQPLWVVLDADALTLISRDPTIFYLLHENCILTPHGGEFARLFPDIAAKLAAPATTGPAYSKVDATREAAARAGCVVLFKGADTVIADPSGKCSINSAHYDRAAPWLATAGSGDVLAGFIAGLLARGFAPMQAAETAAWLHVECARSFGPGLIAEDLPEELPKVFRALGL